jgi:hypothetical protein
VVLSDLKNTLLPRDADALKSNLTQLVNEVGLKSEEIKNLTLAALLTQLAIVTRGGASEGLVGQAKRIVAVLGLGEMQAGDFLESGEGVEAARNKTTVA